MRRRASVKQVLRLRLATGTTGRAGQRASRGALISAALRGSHFQRARNALPSPDIEALLEGVDIEPFEQLRGLLWRQ